MTDILLVRHAALSSQDTTLAGRSDEASLSSLGREQLRRLAEELSGRRLTAIHSSPRLRARLTAEAIASVRGLAVQVADALDELDYGGWTGLTFTELKQRADWRAWNERRASTAPPDGESAQAAQRRICGYLEDLRRRHRNATVVVVTHAEPIRLVLLKAAGLPIGDFHRIDVPPGSITPFRWHRGITQSLERAASG